QRGHQGLSSLDPLQVAQKLAQRCAVRASPLEGQQGLLFDIELRELLDPKQGRIAKRLKTQQERFLFRMSQGKVLLRMRRAVGLNRLLQQGNDRVQSAVLWHPSCE